jgi:hypothetical protein
MAPRCEAVLGRFGHQDGASPESSATEVSADAAPHHRDFRPPPGCHQRLDRGGRSLRRRWLFQILSNCFFRSARPFGCAPELTLPRSMPRESFSTASCVGPSSRAIAGEIEIRPFQHRSLPTDGRMSANRRPSSDRSSVAEPARSGAAERRGFSALSWSLPRLGHSAITQTCSKLPSCGYAGPGWNAILAELRCP